MVFKRRQPLSWAAWLREQVYPRGGFKRAIRYVVHRMRRVPDSPHRVARGVFVGSLVGFLPLPGLQFVAAWIAARLARGNLLAALLATFNTNPVTTPFFAVLAMTLGHWIMGIEAPLTAEYIGRAFGNAGEDLWFNFLALFGPREAHWEGLVQFWHEPREAHWEGLVQFWHEIYVPYFIGALGPGFVLSVISYYVTIPLVTAYQKSRAATAQERAERRRKMRAKLSEAASKLKLRSGAEDDDDSPGTA